MSGCIQKKGKLAIQYHKAEPHAATKTVARKMYADHPDLFTSIENARDALRYHRKHNIVPVAPDPAKKGPKILIFDIETQPMKCWTWGFYKQNINPVQVIQPVEILCWAAKWLDDDYMYFDGRQGEDSDARCCETLWEMFDDADIVVAHNGRAFDTKLMNAAWLRHGMPSPSPYKQVDTLKVARSMFRMGCNKLDYIGRYLEIGKKTEHEGFSLWIKCMEDDAKAWRKMRKYNEQDIYLLEEIYLKIRSWDKSHANVALMYEGAVMRCVVCGSTGITKLDQDSFTGVSVFDSYRCDNCGKTMRDGKRKDKKKSYRHSL